MQVTKSQRDFSSIKSSSFFIESLGMSQMLEEFTTLHELSDEKDLFRSCKSVYQINKERVIAVLQNHSLCLCMLDLVFVDYIFFSNAF